jgi:hypothetical protein
MAKINYQKKKDQISSIIEGVGVHSNSFDSDGFEHVYTVYIDKDTADNLSERILRKMGINKPTNKEQ